uniref:RZZ complex subunit KNTC1/ROD C-terminal domain-containing protein n=3 Tax=Clastoptera arizonana TaxID=38151 RepID=A0A1B6C8P9_9HEMI
MWKKVACGFDGYNETINFGTRVVAESDCAVYEANTLATIQAENQNGLASTPAIYGVHYSDIGCCLNVDSTVIMFNESISETLFISTFDYKVDVFQVIANGLFLFVGLNNGELQLFNISSNKKLFTRTFEDLVENNENLVERAQKCFVAIEFQKKGDDLSVLIVTQRGKVFRMSNLKLEELERLDMTDDVSVDIISKNIFLEEIFTEFSFHQIITSVGFEINEVYSLLLATRKYICWLNFNGDHKKYSLKNQANIKISRMEINQNKSHCFCLTDIGMLLIISLDSFVPILIWNGLHVLDFTLFEGLGFEAKSNLLLLTRGEESNNIILMSLPDFQPKFKLKVQLVSQLIHRQNDSEDILFVEGFGDKIVDSIRFKAVVECHPEFRLQRILRKGRFEEAEKFAQTFNLNVELVYKAHVQYLMQRLQRSSKSGENLKKSFDQFMILLDKITDKEFVSVCCISAIPPDFPSINELLKYGRNCLSNMSKCQINKQSALIQNINSVSERLYTYQIIYKYVDFENWLNFMEVDLIQECRKHLKKGEIREFVVIWSRHEYEIKRKLNDNDVELLLVEIPTSLPVEDTILLLQHIGPTLLTVKPAISQFILKWTIARIQELEIKEKNKWPEIGLFWAHEVLHILDEPLFEFRDHLLPNNQFNVNTPDNAMKTFIKNLEYMQILKNNFNVIITCNEFLELNIDDLVSLILFRTPEDRINNLLNDFLKNMMLEHDLSSDTVITKYIQDMMVNSTEWIEFDQALWEISVSVLVPCIQSIEEKLKCVLGILKVASLPWSNTINKLVDDSLKLNHELTNDIQQYLYFLPQELIYRKYGFKDGFLYNQTHADCFITHILFKDSNTALQDALTIAKTSNNLYQTIIMNLVEKGKYKEATNILSTLDPDVRDTCERSLLICCYSYLRRNMMHKKKNYLEFLPIISSRKDYLHIKNLNSLQGNNKLKAYGETSDIMVTLSKCKRVQDHTATIFNSLSKQQVTVEEVMKNINCYVYLLNVSCEEWIVSLATQTYLADIKLTCFLISKIEGLDSLCDESYNKVTTLLVSTLMHKPVPNINQMEDEVELIHRIATQSLIHCPGNYTITALDMLSWFGLLKNSNICEKNALYSPICYSMTTSTLYTAVKNMFRLYISFRKNSINSLDSCIIEDFDDTIKNNFTENLLHLHNHLQNEQQSLACISLLLSFYWEFISLGISIDADSINHVLNQSISHILKKMIMFKNFNLPCALNFLNYLEETQALLKISEIENSISFSIQRSNSISLLGLTYCKINQINNYYTHFFKKYTQCLWAKKLSDFGISYKEAFKNLKGNELQQLLLKFVNSSGVTLSLLKDFCLFVDVSFQEGLITYLQELLLSWDPVVEIKTNNSNKEEIVFKSTESLRKLCFEILSKVNSESKPDVQNVLLTTWNKVNYYYYEVFSIIIELYEKLTNNIREEFNGYKILLTFLMSYRRVR